MNAFGQLEADPDRNISWAWGQGSSWQIAADEHLIHLWGRVSADDVLWIKGIGPFALPLKVEDLVKIVSPNASEVDEGLVRDACSFLLNETDPEMRPALVETFAGAAFKTNNPLAVRLVGKECFNYSQISESPAARKVVSLAFFFCSTLLRCDLHTKKVPGGTPYSQHIIIRNWT